ncbi:nucleotidyltransferase family protein [Methylococcus sp. Mc7]|uniref:nucleotidyltransferase domain-containing protein n=1 Tax=Methylococcus sp. Mc7 TaxID=2860258 RepID=UPI001C52B175|nr:nucleotidyltransferase family protein [Methylococcus sp. Mc7]QXP82901.1 nucleotidyltransferase family protein [Methylococcus sp. Mc7]
MISSEYHLSAETQILLFCARTHLDADEQATLQKLVARPNLEWSRFMQSAVRHGVVPMVYTRLKALSLSEMPLEIWAELEKRYHAIVFRNLRLGGELVRLEKIFAAEGINAAWFKGPVLARQVYSNVTFRECSDLDVLIPRERADDVNRVLLNQGYRPLYDLTTHRQQQLHEKISNEHCFVNSQNIFVDVHWALTESIYSFSNRGYLATRNVELLGRQVVTFDVTDTLCYLCYHASKHGWALLRWVCDIAELIRCNPELDWDFLMTSERLPIGTPRMLRLGLILAHSGLAAPLPEAVRTWAVSDRKAVSMGRAILQFGAISTTKFPSLIYVSTMDSISDRLRYWIRPVVRPSALELEVVTLPRFLFFLYIPLRYIRLIKKYSGQIPFFRRTKSRFSSTA